MTIWILQNQYAGKVLSDLRIICPDPGLTVDGAGKVTYAQTMSGVGCDGLALLQRLGTVAIRGEDSSWSVRPQPGSTLRDIGGVTVFDVYPGTRIVNIIYDADECNGKGFVTVDPQGVLIGLPTDALLFHELAHAAHMFQGTYNPADPEPGALYAENTYRSSRGLPTRGSWAGGCRGSFTPGPGAAGQQGSQQSPSAQSVAPAVCAPMLLTIPQAIGTNHTLPTTALTQGETGYVININNQTGDTFTEIVVFYKRVGQSGVVYLSNRDVSPGQISSFVCGLCKNLESYVVGFFIGQDLVAQIPPTGNMTPALASQSNPTDIYPCVDSWMITAN